MHTIATKFGALAVAPFLFFGNHFGQPAHPVHPEHPVTPASFFHFFSALSITGVDGPANLDVNQSGTWTVGVKSNEDATLHYSVKWGDEPSTARAAFMAEQIDSSATFTHAYASAGTYYPEFTVSDDKGHTASKTVEVQVGAEVTAPYVESVSPDHGPVGTDATVTGTGFTASSTVTVGGVIAPDLTVHNDGTISFSIPSLANGTYNVRVHNGDVRSNAVTFVVTPTTPNISISGVDAPVSLYVGADGTWTVHTNTTSDSLHYSVVWGDEGSIMARLFAEPESIQSTGTFTHAYASAGTYYPKFTVSDDDGHSASASVSVYVKSI